MRNELKQLVDLATGLLKEADVGREFTMDYVVSRLDSALDEYPHDPIIRSVAQVVNKQIKSGKMTTSQKELYSIYNHFAGLSSTSMIKEAVGDLLYPVENLPKATVSNETQYTHRANQNNLDIKIEHNPLENIFDKNISAATYYDPTLAKLGKYALVEELNNIGVPPSDIMVSAGSDKYIVYDAIFTNKLGTAHIPMFVLLNNGIQAPTHFYTKSEFVELTSENLNKCIVEKATSDDVDAVNLSGGVKMSSSVVSPLFTFEEDAPKPIVVDKVNMPDALKDLASFENAVLDTSTQFTPELVRTAKAICGRELNNMGFKAQVSLSEATDNCIICVAELDSSVGKVEIKLPVEVVDSRPQIPSLFYNDAQKDKIYDFSKEELSSYLTSVKSENGQILRYSNDFFNMTYGQLKDEVINGVVSKDYTRAEQAINRINDQFGQEYYQSALADYAKYLAVASSAQEKTTQQHKCRLLITSGSLEPRCGHYNVAVHRVITDEKGNCELIDRKSKYDNLAESTGAMMRTNKIILT